LTGNAAQTPQDFSVRISNRREQPSMTVRTFFELWRGDFDPPKYGDQCFDVLDPAIADPANPPDELGTAGYAGIRLKALSGAAKTIELESIELRAGYKFAS
jgi:hypothetical protein